MKVFKYISLLFLALLAVFFSLGLFTPSFQYQNSVTVNTTPDKAYTLFTDTTKMNKWLPGFVSFTNDSGGGFAAGSVWKIILLQEGQRYEMTETMTAYKPNEQFSYLLENAVLRNQADVYFKMEGNSTVITAHNLVTGNSIIWRSIFFFYKNDFRERGQKTYEDLKKMIESQS